MKKLLELLVCILHPVAVVLMWVDLATRRDIGGGAKLAWAVFGLIPLVCIRPHPARAIPLRAHGWRPVVSRERVASAAGAGAG